MCYDSFFLLTDSNRATCKYIACVVSVIQRVDVRKSIIKLYISIIEKVYAMGMEKGENQHT